MKLTEIDLYLRKKIYGATINLSKAVKSSERDYWNRKLKALRKSAKQLKKRT